MADSKLETTEMSSTTSSGLNEEHKDEESIMSPDSATMEKIQPTTSKSSDISPYTEPPDGGLNAWLKVFGSFLMYSNIWGFTLSFGAFQSYYEHDLLKTSSASAISWIGTIQSWLLILCGVLSGPLFDLGYFRPMLIIGNFGVVFGIFMLSLAKTYWQVLLAQGVCMGFSAGLLYVPSMALVGLSFSRRRALAMGIVTSGIAVGGVAYIIAFDHVVASKGFPWAIRVLGFITLGICALAFPALLSGTSALAKARTARKLYDVSAFKDPLFLIFTCATFCTFLGYIVPYFYIPTFAQDVLGIDQQFALYILVMGIGGSFFGRLITGYAAHHFGGMITWIVCVLVSSILCFAWIGVKSEGGIIAFSVLWGVSHTLITHLPRFTDAQYRILFRRPGNPPRRRLPLPLPRPLAARHPHRHVLGFFKFRLAYRQPDCWRFAQSSSAAKTRRAATGGFLGRAVVERVLFAGGQWGFGATVVEECEEVEEGGVDMSLYVWWRGSA